MLKGIQQYMNNKLQKRKIPMDCIYIEAIDSVKHFLEHARCLTKGAL